MNWYKIAIRSNYDVVVNRISRIVLQRLLKDEIDKVHLEGGDRTGVVYLNPANDLGIQSKFFPAIVVKFIFSRKYKVVEAEGDYGYDKEVWNKPIGQRKPTKEIGVLLYVPRNWKPHLVSKIQQELKGVLRHEIEHHIQTLRGMPKSMRGNTWGNDFTTHVPEKEFAGQEKLPVAKPQTQEDQYRENYLRNMYRYYTDPKEVEAFAVKFYYLARKTHRPYYSVVDEYFNRARNVVMRTETSDMGWEQFAKNLDWVIDKIKEKLNLYSKQRFPKAVLTQ